MKNLVVITLIIAWVALASGCSTVAGVGQDIKTAGEKIEGAANKKKK